jgi:hypothetical protein
LTDSPTSTQLARSFSMPSKNNRIAFGKMLCKHPNTSQ